MSSSLSPSSLLSFSLPTPHYSLCFFPVAIGISAKTVVPCAIDTSGSIVQFNSVLFRRPSSIIRTSSLRSFWSFRAYAERLTRSESKPVPRHPSCLRELPCLIVRISTPCSPLRHQNGKETVSFVRLLCLSTTTSSLDRRSLAGGKAVPPWSIIFPYPRPRATRFSPRPGPKQGKVR